MLAVDGEHAVADLGSRCAGEQEQLDVVADRLTEHIVGDMLVVAAGDEDHLLTEGI